MSQYRVRARFKDEWFVSESVYFEHGTATGVALGAEIRGADEVEVVNDHDVEVQP